MEVSSMTHPLAFPNLATYFGNKDAWCRDVSSAAHKLWIMALLMKRGAGSASIRDESFLL